MLYAAIFLATCNATMTNKKPFKLQRGCFTQATCLATLRKVEGRSTFPSTRNATIAVAKWGVTREFFLQLATVALQVARKMLRVKWPLFYYFSWNAEHQRQIVRFSTKVLTTFKRENSRPS